MEITERQKLILERIVQEYIDSARPVSSQLLEKKYNFKICPAMIRIEMEKLTDKGFLSQPFVSAGRIPTDKSYRFFVDRLLEERIPEFKNLDEVEKIIKEEKKNIFRFTSRLIKFLAHSSSTVALLHFLNEDMSLIDGWDEVVREPEFEDRDLFFDFSEFMEDLEENIDELDGDSQIKIYIGGENPFGKTKDFSVISSRCLLPDGKEGMVVVTGPKRMAYEKNISLINSLTKLMEEF